MDVFSFAIIIFELLSGRVAMAAIANRGDQLDYEAVRAHAEETANGFRLSIPVNWPAPIRSLIEDCWAQKSGKRPTFATIERRLEDIKVRTAANEADVAFDDALANLHGDAVQGTANLEPTVTAGWGAWHEKW